MAQLETLQMDEIASHLQADIPEIIADNAGTAPGENRVYDAVITSAPTAMLDTLVRNGVTELDLSEYPTETAEERASAILLEGYDVMETRAIPAPNLQHYDQAQGIAAQGDLSLQDALARVEASDPSGVPQNCGTPVEAPDGSTYYLPPGYSAFEGGTGPNAGHHYMSGPDGLVFTPFYAPIAVDGYERIGESIDELGTALALGSPATVFNGPAGVMAAGTGVVLTALDSGGPIPESVFPPESSCEPEDYDILD